ncbi:MAG: hypothetical protein ACREQY_18735 [Candidatus Binatia bacterium]
MRTFAVIWSVAFGVALVAGTAGAQPGPNGRNNYGLCKAYFAGSDTGREHKRNAPPFVELERQACEQAGGCDDDEDVENAVMEFCEDATPGGK